MYKCKHFDIKEIVSKIVYDYYTPRYGEDFIWGFFQEQALKELDFIREEWERYLSGITKYKYVSKAIVINNWSFGGEFTQRGLRSNLDPMVREKDIPYVSAHCLAIGFDLEPVNKLYTVFHAFLWDLMLKRKLKFFRRLECLKSAPTWGHIDGMNTPDGKPVEFTA